jgi:hypothetical protein
MSAWEIGANVPAGDDRKTAKDFQTVAARDKAAAEYFSSEAFLTLARAAVQEGIVQAGRKYAYIKGEFKPKKQDIPAIEQVCAKLKEEFPELNHMRIGVKWICPVIVADTKKNTLAHRAAFSVYRDIPS